MSERKTFHHFSLKDSYPRYIYSIDNIGNKYVEIELVGALCITEGRIATDSFVFHDFPDFTIMDPLTDEFIDEYFRLMKKLALCFEFISMEKVSDILRWENPFYPRNFPEHLKYQDVDGFMEMQYGPMLMLMHYIMHYQIITKKNNAEEYKAYRFVKRITQRMSPIVEKRNKLHGYYVKSLYLLKKKKSCGPVKIRAIEEVKNKSIPFIYINGLSFVLEDDVKSRYPEYLAKYPYNIKKVRGIGTGVALLDLINPTKRIRSSWYNFPAEKVVATKICSKCKKEKAITEFDKNRSRKKDGLAYRCKSCKREDKLASKGKDFVYDPNYRIVRDEKIIDQQRKCWTDNWGPLYPAILFKNMPEELVKIIDLSFFD